MTNFAIARKLSGITSAGLAEQTGSSRAYISQLESGVRNLGRSNLEQFAALLNADPAWLLGQPSTLPVTDPQSGSTCFCQIIHSVEIPDYGMLYLVHYPETGDDFGVILADGVQFTVTDWQSMPQPRSIEEIAEFEWMDATGREAVMLEGLPRIFQ